MFPRKENDLKFVFKSCKGEKWSEICFQMVEVWNISCKDILKINNWENYLNLGVCCDYLLIVN